MRSFTSIAILGTCVAGLTSATQAALVFGTPSGTVAGVQGLTESVYHRGGDQSVGSPPSPTDIATELNYAATTAPNYSFINSADSFDYSGGDTTPTNAFLGRDASGAAALDTAPLQTTLFDAEGYINIKQPGTYTFYLFNADDGAAIFLGGNGTPGSGTLVEEQNYAGNLNNATSPQQVNFTAAGLYPIEVFHYNQTIGGAGGANLFFTVAGGPVTYTYNTTAVPEPATLGLLGLGGFGLLARRRRA